MIVCSLFESLMLIYWTLLFLSTTKKCLGILLVALAWRYWLCIFTVLDFDGHIFVVCICVIFFDWFLMTLSVCVNWVMALTRNSIIFVWVNKLCGMYWILYILSYWKNIILKCWSFIRIRNFFSSILAESQKQPDFLFDL